jgi:hypothetical protein
MATARRAKTSGDPGRGSTWLRLVPPMSFAPPRAPFIIMVIALIGTGLVGLLLLNTSMQRGAFEIASLQQATAQLQKQQAGLEQRASRLQAPASVTAKATALGMVPDANPVFLRLSDGKVLGKPVPATAPPPPAPPAHPAHRARAIQPVVPAPVQASPPPVARETPATHGRATTSKPATTDKKKTGTSKTSKTSTSGTGSTTNGG